MRCKKCGEEYRPGQTFCLRCGSPIVDNQPAYSDEFDEYDDYDADLDATIGELDVPYDDEQALASGDTEDLGDLSSGEFRRLRTRENYRTDNVVNNRYNNNFEDDYDLAEEDNYSTPYDDDEDDIYESAQRSRNTRKDARRPQTRNSQRRREPEKKPKKKGILSNRFVQILLVLVVFLALAGIVYGISTTIIKSSDKEEFNSFYDKGYKYEENTEYEAAINMYNKASRYASGKDEQVKAYEGMWRCYQQMEGQESEEISVLKKLINIDESNVSYYEALILLYQNTGNSDKIQALIDSAKDSKVKEALKDFDSAKPVPSLKPDIYNKSISVALSALEGSTIYYTLDDSEPTTSSEVYQNKFKFKKNGTYIIKAFAVSKDGKSSQVLRAEYVIEKGTVDPPSVTPDSGEYSDKTEVDVDVPDGVTVYYTEDGTEPNKKSIKYSKSKKITIPEGNSIYRFIAYNEGGVASEIVTRVYLYKPNFAYSYDSARDILVSYLANNGKLDSTELYNQEDGSITYVTSRGITRKESTSEDGSVDYTHYYIMEVEHKDGEGNSTFSGTYAVGCNSGKVYGASGSGDNYTISKN